MGYISVRNAHKEFMKDGKPLTILEDINLYHIVAGGRGYLMKYGHIEGLVLQVIAEPDLRRLMSLHRN